MDQSGEPMDELFDFGRFMQEQEEVETLGHPIKFMDHSFIDNDQDDLNLLFNQQMQKERFNSNEGRY